RDDRDRARVVRRTRTDRVAQDDQRACRPASAVGRPRGQRAVRGGGGGVRHRRVRLTGSRDTFSCMDSRVDHHSWLRAALAVFAVGWGANQFAPLLYMYRTGQGLTQSDVTAMFSVYIVGLLPTLL